MLITPPFRIAVSIVLVFLFTFLLRLFKECLYEQRSTSNKLTNINSKFRDSLEYSDGIKKQFHKNFTYFLLTFWALLGSALTVFTLVIWLRAGVWKTPKLAKKLIGLFIILTLLLTLALGMMELFYYKWSSRFFDNALILLHLHFSIFAKFMYIFLFLFISCFLSMSFLRTSTPAFPVLVSGHDY